MEKIYITPELDIYEFDADDVVTMSLTGDGTVELPPAPLKK